MPQLLKTAEVDTWITRYNFFLLLRGLTYRFKQQIFTMFNKVLIESLLKVEEEVMIIVTELISEMIEMYVET